MNQKLCDLCKTEIGAIDRVYFVSFGEKSKVPLMKGNSKSGEICYACCKLVEEAVSKLKKN